MENNFFDESRNVYTVLLIIGTLTIAGLLIYFYIKEITRTPDEIVFCNSHGFDYYNFRGTYEGKCSDKYDTKISSLQVICIDKVCKWKEPTQLIEVHN